MKKAYKKGFLYFGLLSLIAAFQAYPSSIHKTIFQGVAPVIKIKNKEVSPAAAAFEDIYDIIDTNETRNDEQELLKETLVAGEVDQKFIQIISQRVNEEPTAYRVADISEYKVLSGVSFSDRGQEIGRLRPQRDENTVISDIRSTLSAADTEIQSDIKTTEINRNLASSFGGQLVTKNTFLPQGDFKNSNFKNSSGSRSKRRRDRREHLNRDKESQGISIASTDDLSSARGQHLRGTIELEKGLPYLSNEMYFEVLWHYSGEDLSYGFVNAQEAQFSIDVEHQSGQIFVELWHVDGVLVGLGELDINEVPQSANLRELIIKVLPVSEHIEANVISSYSYKNKVIPMIDSVFKIWGPSGEITPTKESKIQLNNVDRGSFVPVQVSAENHWGTIRNLSSVRNQNVQLHSNSVIEALLNLSSKNKRYSNSREHGIIWGTVTERGRPVSGAEVELSFTEDLPIYFNAIIPDNNMKTTSENGQFAFAFVESGVHSLRVKKEGVYFPAEIVIVENNFVTSIEIEVQQQNRNTISVYDAFSGEYLPSYVDRVGTEKNIFYETGRGNILLSGQNSKVEFDIDAGKEYLLLRKVINQKSRHIDVPLVKAQWVQKLITELGENLSTKDVGLIGFIEGDDYKLNIPFASKETRVVFFDAQGNAVLNPTVGGGFIVCKLPTGVQYVVITSENSKKEFIDFIWSDKSIINLTTIHLSL